MLNTAPWQQQPPHFAPIRPEFADSSLLLALEGYPLAAKYKLANATGPFCKSISGAAAMCAGSGTTRSYTVSSSSSLAIQVTSSNASPDTAIEFNTSMSWTFMCRISQPSGSGTNPGFWRSQSDELGTTFFIDNGNTRRPWLRVNGTDVIKAASGDQWPSAGYFDILARFSNGKLGDVWWGGQKRHSATTAATQNSQIGSNGVRTIGRQNTNEYINGQWAAIRFWSKALSDAQCARLTSNAWEFYQPALRGLFPGFASSAAFLPRSVNVNQSVNRAATY